MVELVGILNITPDSFSDGVDSTARLAIAERYTIVSAPAVISFSIPATEVSYGEYNELIIWYPALRTIASDIWITMRS